MCIFIIYPTSLENKIFVKYKNYQNSPWPYLTVLHTWPKLLFISSSIYLPMTVSSKRALHFRKYLKKTKKYIYFCCNKRVWNIFALKIVLTNPKLLTFLQICTLIVHVLNTMLFVGSHVATSEMAPGGGGASQVGDQHHCYQPDGRFVSFKFNNMIINSIERTNKDRNLFFLQR